MNFEFSASALFTPGRGILTFLAIQFVVLFTDVTAAIGQEGSSSPDAKIIVNGDARTLKIVGLNKQEASDLSVKVWLATADTKTMPAITGSLNRNEDSIEFRPKYALQKNKRYRAQLSDGSNQVVHELLTEFRTEIQESTRIMAVDPRVNVIPSNLLKFYVHFSAPMQKGEIYQYVSLHKENGEKIELPFLELEQELWSRDSLRVTFLLDPGRIKRGLKPREDMGPIFEPNHSYEFRISGKWPDSNGKPLGKDYVKRFSTSDEDFVQPNPENWTINSPGLNTIDPLTIELDECLDREMLYRVIELSDHDDLPIDGKIFVNDSATEWRFVPHLPWRKGALSINIDTVLEDLSGNSIGRQFDVDRFESKSEQPAPFVKLKTTVR